MKEQLSVVSGQSSVVSYQKIRGDNSQYHPR